MKIKYLGNAKDLRTNTQVIYATMLIDDYLELVGDDFSEFYIQRRRETHKAYKRLERDILEGALLPSITLAIKPDYVETIEKKIVAGEVEKIEEALAQNGIINILDGLQRTYILKDLKGSGKSFKEGQSLLIEFWLEKEIKHLIYRLIVLNSGQKPMSMRHQVELLFLTIKENLEKEIDGLEIYLERDGNKRNKPRKYSLDRLVTAYQSFLTKNTEVKRENIIAKKIIENEILDSDEDNLDDNFNNFKFYLQKYCEIDSAMNNIYKSVEANWLADENVMNSFFAALADFGSISNARQARIDIALKKLLEEIKRSNQGDDPLALESFNEIKSGLNPKKDNVGFATRKLLFNGFKEFFREEGEKSLGSCWIAEAE